MTYHKIQTVYLRDPETNHKTLLEGQYAKPEFEYLRNNIWEWTEKLDGTNIRVVYKDGEISFAGKTDNASIPSFLVNRLVELFPKGAFSFEDGFLFQGDAVLYGEGIGAKIQKGGGNYTEGQEHLQDFVLFDVKVGDWWLKRSDVYDVANCLGLKVAPVVGLGTLPEMVNFVKSGFMSQFGKQDFLAEGVVARPVIELFDRSGARVITKVKHKDFK